MEEKLKQNTRIMLKSQLALERYCDDIGREKFVFFDDGDINYIWKKGRKKG